MTRSEPARYRTTNWKSYNAALKRRGSLLIGLDKDMIWRTPKAGRTGRPPVFGDAAILSMADLDWPVPDSSTLSRRQKRITVQISNRRAPGPSEPACGY